MNNGLLDAYGTPPGTFAQGLTLLNPGGLVPTATATFDKLSLFTSAYDGYLIIGHGIKPGADDTLALRFANAGAVDSGTSYNTAPLSGVAALGAAATSIGATNVVTTAGIGSSFRIEIENANGVATVKSGRLFSIYQSAAAPTYTSSSTAFAYTPANVISGFRLYWSSGSSFLAVGNIRVYGYQNQ